jgi:catechol 2,3-dioxygenase-like lactoylglutathione lyase family enzyme
MSTEASAGSPTDAPPAGTLDMKIEVITVPVSDVDRAKSFYQGLGWRLDADIALGEQVRVVQLTPPHSNCSISLGRGLARVRCRRDGARLPTASGARGVRHRGRA